MPRISSNIERRELGKEFILAKVKGNLVDLNTFSNVLDNNVDVLEWLVEIRKKNDEPAGIDVVRVIVCPTSIGEVSGLKERIEASLRASVEFKPDEVIITTYDEISERVGGAGLGFNRVIDMRPK